MIHKWQYLQVSSNFVALISSELRLVCLSATIHLLQLLRFPVCILLLHSSHFDPPDMQTQRVNEFHTQTQAYNKEVIALLLTRRFSFKLSSINKRCCCSTSFFFASSCCARRSSINFAHFCKKQDTKNCISLVAKILKNVH